MFMKPQLKIPTKNYSAQCIRKVISLLRNETIYLGTIFKDLCLVLDVLCATDRIGKPEIIERKPNEFFFRQ